MKGFKNVKAYVEGKGFVTTTIGVENGKIAYIGEDRADIENIAELGNAMVLPGFIDQHVHGAAGYDAMDGTREALNGIANALAKEGTTAFLATTMTQSPENIQNALTAVKAYRAENPKDGAEVLGVHLEGPFISLKHVGAQPIEYVARPAVDTFEEYQSASGGNIRLVTLAAEEDGAEELVRHLKNTGVVASLGHTNAGYADVEKAVANGATNVTHTYNAQRALHHREVGTVGSAMLFDKLNCEMICDTIHVSVPAMKLVFKNKPLDKVTLITDAMRAKHMPDGESELGGQKVIVKNGEARLVDGTLAGSVLKMNVALKNVHEKVGIDLARTVESASANPAKNLGVYGEMGSIAVGKKANFAVLADDFSVVLTVREGNIIYKA